MNLTYNEIFNEMKNVYLNESRKTLEKGSETEKRLEAVASELYSLSCYGDFILRQAFVQSATGEYLDMHGAIRDCKRKRACYASGYLTFYLEEPAQEEIIIARGTVCSVLHKPYLQYATAAQVVIPTGETAVTVEAIAVECGEIYNVPANAISVMVNAPVGVYGVYNREEFSGGSDEESDLSFRNRIANNYSIIPNGVNASSLENAVMKLISVRDCYIPPAENPGEMKVIVRINDTMIKSPLEMQILSRIGVTEILGVNTVIEDAVQKDFSLSVSCNLADGFDSEKIIDQIKTVVKNYCSSLRISRQLNLSDVSKQLNGIEGISGVSVSSPDALGNVINCSTNEYLHLKETAVKCYEEHNLL